MVGQAKRNKRGYVMLPVKDAEEIHIYLSKMVKDAYQISYKNMKP